MRLWIVPMWVMFSKDNLRQSRYQMILRRMPKLLQKVCTLVVRGGIRFRHKVIPAGVGLGEWYDMFTLQAMVFSEML